MKVIHLGCFVLSFILIGLMPSTAANELSKIQQSISQQQEKINQQKKQRDALQATLRSQETQLGQVHTDLKKTELSLSDLRHSIKNTEQEIKRLEAQELQQKEKLKVQLDSAYRAGVNPSILQRLLSEEAKSVDRMSAYYGHLNQIRIDAIYELRHTQQTLVQRRDELKAQQAGQQAQLNTHKKQERELTKIKAERESTLRSIDKALAMEQGRLDELKRNESALRRQIEQAVQAARQQEQQEIAQLEKQKNQQEKRSATEQEKQQFRAGHGLAGKYNMPVTGRILHRFGSTQMGELKWNAVVIEAKSGTPVKVIADGKVVMANWFDSYGQFVLVDHGKGYVSFYGYNQSLAVEVGQRVKAGQTIAYVGNSGGQKRASLYFGIHRNGVAVNPLNWVK